MTGQWDAMARQFEQDMCNVRRNYEQTIEWQANTVALNNAQIDRYMHTLKEIYEKIPSQHRHVLVEAMEKYDTLLPTLRPMS